MAINTTSFLNTPQAGDDLFTSATTGLTEDSLFITYLAVMANDLGGAAKTLYSIDNGTNSIGMLSPTDLLAQDIVRTEALTADTSAQGAKIWITTDGKVGYDASTLSGTFKAQLQHLSAGQWLTDTFTYAIRLGNGTLSWATATVQIAGVNDAPVVTGAVTATVAEDHASITLDALANATDVDDGATLSVTNLPGPLPAGVTYNAATHSFTLDPSNAAFQHLAAGGHTTVTVNYGVSDGTATTAASVSWNVTGTNDAPVAAAKTDVALEGAAVIHGKVVATDVDDGAALTYSLTSGAPDGLAFHADGSYSFDPTGGAYDHLKAGATQDVVVSYKANDGTADSNVSTLTITITGTNDAPVVSGAVTGTATEDLATVTLNALANASDVDDGTTLSVTNLPSSLPAGVTYDAATHSFTLDPSNAAFQHLAAGDHTTVTVSYGVSDGTATTAASVSWNVTGTNDVPVIAGASTSAVTEDTGLMGGQLVTSGVLTIADVDQGQSNFAAQPSVASTYGTFTLADNGTWTYTASDSQNSIQQLGAGQSITDSFTAVSSDGTASQVVTVTIHGTNDAPVITSAAQSGAVQEDTTLTATGTVASSDVDHGATAAYSGNASGSYGSFAVVASTGVWTYTLDNAAHQDLAQGETQHETFAVTVTDDFGATATQNVVLTITGTNDAPVITSAAQSGAVQEDTTLTATGTVASSDVDHGATAAYTGDATGTYGSFAVDASTGVWTYTLDNAAHQNLAQGETQHETFAVTVIDDFGATATQNVILTITGTNDAPVITSTAQSGEVKEDTTLVTTGTVASSDVDHGATAAYTGDAMGTYGSFAVDASTGVWTYTLDNTAHQNLAQGETQHETFAVTVTDDFGATATQNVVLTITGTNDAPVITSAAQSGAVKEDTTLTATGTVTSSDVDHGAAAAYTGDATGTYGSFAVDASTGVWTYTLDNAAHQNLAQGETQHETFTVTVTDDFGATATQNVVLTITGTNDAPVITSAAQSGEVKEDTTLVATGTVTSSDADHGATAAYTGDATGSYGSFAVDASTGVWTYTLDNAAHQDLAQGETQHETFAVTVTDDFGATATQNVVLTITGTNDAPVITSTAQSGEVKEDTTLVATGTVTSSDADHGATAAYSGNASGSYGSYGSFAVDTSTGVWTYTLDNAAHQNLAQGETQHETFAVTVTDDFGATATQNVVLTITGTNDAPVITSAAQSGAVQEDTMLTATGTVTSSDVDHGAAAAYTGDATGTYGSFAVDASTGVWTYTLDNAAHQDLAQGETQHETFAVTVTDDFGATVTQNVVLTITGTNDAPVISAAVTGNATEDLAAVTLNALANASDVDDGTTLSVTNLPGSLPDGVSYDAATHSFTLDPGSAAFQYLAAGQSAEVVINYGVSDGIATTAASVSWNVTGTNDVPVIAGASTSAVTEDTGLTGGQLVTGGLLTIADVDQGQSNFAAQPSVASTYGTFTLADNGTWTYAASDSQNSIQQLGAGQSITDSFTAVSSDGTASQVVTVTIHGTNDAPVITSTAQSGAVQEDTTLTATGTVASSDVDHGATAAYSGAATGTYGSFAVDASTGVWTYTLDNAAHQNLAQGETQHETFAVTVTDDFGATATQNVVLTITGTNDAPVITSGAGAGAPENSPTTNVVYTAVAQDADAGDTTFTFHLGGTDAGLFDINASTGAVTFKTSPNFEAPDDGNHDNVYDITVSATDAHGLAGAAQVVSISVTNVNEAPAITSNASASVTENIATSTTVYTAVAIDPDAGTSLTYAITGTDAARFNVDSSTGAVTFKASPNFEAPADSGANNVYDIVVHANDGTNDTTKAVAITVTNASETPATSISGIDISADSGSSTSDFITNVASQTITGTLSAGLVAGESLLGSVDGGAHWIDISNKVSGTSINWDGATLAGSSSIQIKVTNTDGNSGPTAGQSYVLDTSAPAAAAVTSITSDSGTVGDHVTNDTTLTINGTAEAGSSVQVFRDGVSIGIAVAIGGAWSLADGTTLSNGTTYQYTAKATDAAGNVGAVSATYSATIDTTAAAPSAPDLIAASDSGSSNTDNLTNATTPTFTGSGAEAGATVTLFDTNGTTVLGTGVANGSGLWSITSSALGSGAHTLTARQTDLAGNTGTASTGLAVIVDTTAPTVSPVNFTATKVGNTWTVAVSATDALSGVSSIHVVSDSGLDLGTQSGANFSGTAANGGGASKMQMGNTLTATVIDVAGNTLTAAHVAPAGIAGGPINLALGDRIPDLAAQYVVAISGVPSGWTINAGTDNGAGTWTVLTSDPSSLTVTTPTAFVGALVLDVTMTWTNPDGSAGAMMVADNVEAYAPGSPIFALSGGDHLTGSTNADLFVVAQPITNDTINGFDTAADKIDLVGFAGFTSFADVQANVANDANGNAVLTLSNGGTIMLQGVDAASLTADDFVFNQEPVMTNAGTLTIGDGAVMPFGGILQNTGTIALGSMGAGTQLEVLVESLSLQGGGHVTLSDNDNNVIFGGTAAATLDNVDNTISGAGQIGAGQMTLVNAGTIIADGNHALVIDTGTTAVANSGTLEATGGGGLVIDGAVNGAGSLWANGGDITIHGDVAGHGSATIDGSCALEFGAASDADVGFAGNASGTLTVDHAAAFTGTLAGLNADDSLHFGDIAFSSATQVSYTANAAGTAGSLVVSDGTHTAQMALVGQYSAADFQLVADQDGSTVVANTAAGNATLLGTAGADVLAGTGGNDIIVGGAGSDMLAGGAGSDTFLFRGSDAGAVDTITDFDVGAGGDVLNVGLLLQGYSPGADLSQFISLRQSGDDTIVSIDSDGAGSAHGFQDLLVMQGVTGLDFSTLIAHVDAAPLP